MNDCLHSYSYRAEGNQLRLDGGSTAVYTYDALDERVRVAANGQTSEYLFDPFGRRVSSWLLNGSVAGFGNEGRIYWDGGLLATRDWNGQTYFHHSDWQGTERLRTNFQGQVANVQRSLASGELFSQTNDPYGASQDNAQFTGQEYDAETNTDHFQFRQYQPTQGRWLSPDPYDGSYDFSNPQSFNRYAYVLNNPLTFTDPDGLRMSTCEDDSRNGEPCGGGGGIAILTGQGFAFGAGWDEFQTQNALFSSWNPTSTGGTVYGGGASTNGTATPTGPTQVWTTYNGFTDFAALGLYNLATAPQSGSSVYFSGSLGAPRNGMPQPKPTPTQCAQRAARKNAVALTLDVAGFGAGFLPGGELVVAGAQATISVASGVNSAVGGDAAGAALGVLGLPASFAGYTAKFVGVGAKAIPGLGSAIAAFGALNDGYAAYQDYQACLARH